MGKRGHANQGAAQAKKRATREKPKKASRAEPKAAKAEHAAVPSPAASTNPLMQMLLAKSTAAVDSSQHSGKRETGTSSQDLAVKSTGSKCHNVLADASADASPSGVAASKLAVSAEQRSESTAAARATIEESYSSCKGHESEKNIASEQDPPGKASDRGDAAAKPSFIMPSAASDGGGDMAKAHADAEAARTLGDAADDWEDHLEACIADIDAEEDPEEQPDTKRQCYWKNLIPRLHPVADPGSQTIRSPPPQAADFHDGSMLFKYFRWAADQIFLEDSTINHALHCFIICDGAFFLQNE